MKEVIHATTPAELSSPSLEELRSNGGEERVTTHGENNDHTGHLPACAALQVPPLQAASRDDGRWSGTQGQPTAAAKSARPPLMWEGQVGSLRMHITRRRP